MSLARRKGLGLSEKKLSWQYPVIGIIILIAVIGGVYAYQRFATPSSKIGIININEPIYDFNYVHQAEKALDDPSIKAVVLKINSPGGGVEACFQTEASISRLALKKPVIADLELYAASGAYLIASAADNIFTHEHTITGSFGVIAIWVSYEDYFENRGIDWNVWKTGESKDWFAIYRDPTEEENERIQEIVESWRDKLFNHIIRNRSLSENSIDDLRDGSTIYGIDALGYDLADEFGGYDDAVKEAAKRAGLKKGEYEEFYLS